MPKEEEEWVDVEAEAIIATNEEVKEEMEAEAPEQEQRQFGSRFSGFVKGMFNRGNKDQGK